VVTPLPGGPCESVGILAGDKIIRINDSIVAGVKIDNGKIYKKLRGEKGSEVRLSVLRGSNVLDFKVLRDRIPVKSVEIAYMLDDATGYVKVNRFTAKTYTEFMEAIRPMAEEKNMRNLVVDLRGNPGGYLDEATQMLSQFFPEGKLLVYTEGRTDSRQEYNSSGRARFNIQQIAILIDEGSASASEIMAGAIQDHDRGWVIGRRSFGKGLVQEEYPLTNKGRLRLTVARYFTPSGRCIQRNYKGNTHYNNDEANRLKSGELTDGTKMAVADTTKFYTGMGRVVYSGGGITPDVFIPLDTSYFNPFFNEMNGHLPQFLSRWMEQHKGGLPTDANEFEQNYKVGDDIIAALADYAIKQGAKRDEKQLLQSKNELKLRLKSRMARVLFGDTVQYKVINSDDPAIEKALQLIKSGASLK
jgi:carboxyl-terminal processing protease